MEEVSHKILKRRACVERWKANNREYYLQQKRQLSARPEYRAKMRAKYKQERDELKALGYLPRKMGRPRLYDGEEAKQVKREQAKEASARYRLRNKFSLLVETYESTTTESPSEDSD